MGRKVIKKSKKPQRPKKSAKTIGLEELSFLISNTRLAVAKMNPNQNSIRNSQGRSAGIVEAFKK